MSTIPASDIVSVTPNVLNAGGSALDLNGLMISQSTFVPIGVVEGFSNPDDVGDYFGLSSDEYKAAVVYFNGFTNSNKKPGSMLAAQYPAAAVSAYLRGGDISGMTLASLQALTGELDVVVDGYPYTAAGLNFSAASSFSAAAALIQTALQASAPAAAAFTASISPGPGGYGIMTVTAVASGTLVVGQTVAGSGVPANTIITGLLSGTGGTGTYKLSNSPALSSRSMTTSATGPTVTYNSIPGAFIVTSSSHGVGSTIAFATNTMATSLLLTQATGAVTSQGANATTPSAFMQGIVANTQNWATFFTIFDPDNGSGTTNRLAFSSWTNGKNNRYAYIPWDTDASPTTVVPALTSLGYLIQEADYSGSCPIWCPDYIKAAFISGMAASIDFTETNGRTTLKFRNQTGLVPDVTDQSTKDNLVANGYNGYGDWATANDDFRGVFEGTISGPYQWFDSYINQIWLNNALQQALMSLLFNSKSIPYNTAGYTLIEAACADPINAAVNFGAIRAGVTLSASQIAQVNSAAGTVISNVLTQRGWYLQVKDATPQVRQARQSPPVSLWYMDGESVQKINLASIEIQ